MRLRCAISLVELLAVLSGCSVVLGLTGSLIHQAMRSQSQTRHFFDVERNVQRLSRQFRLDVHGAEQASIETPFADEQGTLRLEFPSGERVEYRRLEDKIIRTAVEPGEPAAREDFSLTRSMTVELEEREDPPRWALSIRTAPPQPSKDVQRSLGDIRATMVNLHVSATLGRDHRYAPPSAGEEGTP
jgi:hypothetical protein